MGAEEGDACYFAGGGFGTESPVTVSYVLTGLTGLVARRPSIGFVDWPNGLVQCCGFNGVAAAVCADNFISQSLYRFDEPPK